MPRHSLGPSGIRLFVLYAVASLIPVVMLGVLLAGQVAAQANARGLARARADARLVSQGIIAPLLGDAPLPAGLGPATPDLRHNIAAIVADRQVLRLRLRDLDANVVFTSDGSVTTEKDEAARAARGTTIALLTTLEGDNGAGGIRVAEVYAPLRAAKTDSLIGVVEMYLPYAPIAADIDTQRRAQTWTLAAGLVVLWLVGLAVTGVTTRRLRRSARENAFLAAHDPFTGLANRRELLRLAARMMARAPAALLVFDLDRFRQVNDALGHQIGDRLLDEVADRLVTAAASGEVVARLGGNAFAMVIGAASDEQALARLADIAALLTAPLALDGLPVMLEYSTGYALSPEDATDPDMLLLKAEVAMFAAKQASLGPIRHRDDLDTFDAGRLRLLGELAAAIRADQLVLHYQPKISLTCGAVASIEALVRWQHPNLGLLYPDAFLPAAEQTELIEPLTTWVLAEALAAINRLDPTGWLSVAVNVSARNLSKPHFALAVLAALTTADTPCSRLVIEMTETAVLTAPEVVAANLATLAAAGVTISIDDFGAGQTSLAHLARLPIGELKIDRSFVNGMSADPRTAAIVQSMIDLGHRLGYTVTAEGAETEDDLNALTVSGCDQVQGYVFARPCPESEMATFLAARTTGAGWDSRWVSR